MKCLSAFRFTPLSEASQVSKGRKISCSMHFPEGACSQHPPPLHCHSSVTVCYNEVYIWHPVWPESQLNGSWPGNFTNFMMSGSTVRSGYNVCINLMIVHLHVVESTCLLLDVCMNCPLSTMKCHYQSKHSVGPSSCPFLMVTVSCEE